MNEKIKFGFYFNGIYSFFGLIIFLIAVIVLLVDFNFFKLTICILFMMFGVLLFLNLSGLEIDYQKKRMRFYYWYIFVVHDVWIDLKCYDKLTLHYNKYHKVYNRNTMRQNSIIYATYDLTLIGDEKHEKRVFLEFNTYIEARKKLEEYSAKLGLQPVDIIEIALKEPLR